MNITMEHNMLQTSNIDYISVVQQIKNVILKSRYRAAQMVNREMLSLYYSIGGFISRESRNAKWGSGAISAISALLKEELPGLRGFSEGNIKKMRLFYEAWPQFINRASATHDFVEEAELKRASATHVSAPFDNRQIVLVQLDTEEFSKTDVESFLSVGFTHHYEIIKKSADLAERLFYIRLCAEKCWSIDELKYHLKENLYKTENIQTTNFCSTIQNEEHRQRALQSFKDEYLVDFINIEDDEIVDERILENAIVRNIKNFIMAMGPDFTFMGNQYRLKVGDEEFYVDLLFYHRRLRCLVAVELKRGRFHSEYVGKLNLYLSALDEYVKLPDENPSIGIILCRSKDDKVVEFAFRDTFKAMGVATYKTERELAARQEIESQFMKMGEELKKLL